MKDKLVMTLTTYVHNKGDHIFTLTSS